MKFNNQLLEIIRHTNSIGYSADGGRLAAEIITDETGDYMIVNGTIRLNESYADGQWIHISGSKLNDGLYIVRDASDGADIGLYALSNGTDDDNPTDGNETFTGRVKGLKIDRSFMELAREVMEFNTNEGNNTLVGESVVGLYSWQKGVGQKGNMPADWEERFANKLWPYRRIFTTVAI